MKKLIAPLAIAITALTATPALAADFVGPRVEARAGFEDVDIDVGSATIGGNGLVVGAGIGGDIAVVDRVRLGLDLGAEMAYDDVHKYGPVSLDAEREFEVSARLGYVVGESVLVYGRAGLANKMFEVNLDTLRAATKESGFRYGAGVEVAVAGPLYVKAEYRVTDFHEGVQSEGAVAALGLRF